MSKKTKLELNVSEEIKARLAEGLGQGQVRTGHDRHQPARVSEEELEKAGLCLYFENAKPVKSELMPRLIDSNTADVLQ